MASVRVGSRAPSTSSGHDDVLRDREIYDHGHHGSHGGDFRNLDRISDRSPRMDQSGYRHRSERRRVAFAAARTCGSHAELASNTLALDSAMTELCVPNHCVERTGGSLHARFSTSVRFPLPPVAHAGVRCYRPHAGIGTDTRRFDAQPRRGRILSHSSEPIIALPCELPRACLQTLKQIQSSTATR